MHILFVGCVAIALGFQVFRKSEEYCPYEQRMYVNVSAPSLILCATYCDVDKTECARFVYDAVQEECIILHAIQNMLQGIQNNGSVYISTGQRLFLSSNEGCVLGYDFDATTNTCIKVYDVILSWDDARARCPGDNGDLVTIATLKMWEFVSKYINCTTVPYWIGLKKKVWLTGETFENVNGLPSSTVLFPDNPDKICGRVKFSLGFSIIKQSVCAHEKRFLCEPPLQ